MEYTENECIDAIKDSVGYCTSCKEIVEQTIEQDAEIQECNFCENHTSLYGVEQALLLGFIKIIG